MNDRLKTASLPQHDDDCDTMEPEYTPPASLYTPTSDEEPIPAGYEAVRLSLDGRVAADLSWTSARESAKKYIDQGLRLFWDLDLGLFDGLAEPLGSHQQFLSLGLSLDHFRDTLWESFHRSTAGLCLYRGSADFSIAFRWDEQQLANLQAWLKELFQTPERFNEETGLSVSTFSTINASTLEGTPGTRRLLAFFCSLSCCEYLDLLGSRLPDNIPLFVDLDSSAISDAFTRAQLLSQELYAQFYALPFSSAPLPRTAICLPPISQYLPSTVAPLIKRLESLTPPHRAIPESLLTSQWNELDTLIIAPNPSPTLQRKLNGFRAAGGTVICA